MTDVRRSRDLLAEHPGIHPLTPAQRGLWFLENFNPNSSFYIVGFGLRFTGALDVSALEAALADCVARQEALRARFITLDGRPYQVFVPDQPVHLPVVELSGVPAVQAHRQLRERFEELAGQPFDLTGEAPLRAVLVRLAPHRHALLLAIHHIVFDAWSTGVFLAQLGAAYTARSAGLHDEPVAPAAGFGAVAARQAARAGEWGAQAAGTTGPVRRWRDRLVGAPALDLPTDRHRPRWRGFAGGTVRAQVDADTTARLRAVAADLRVSPFTVLATAFNLLLAQLSGQDDIVIGVPLAGRDDPATHELVGFFTNTLPLRVDLHRVRSFRDAVQRHREPVLDLLASQHTPFLALVDELRPARAANRNPFFDVTFQHLPRPDEGMRFGEVTVELFGDEWHTAQFDLSCDVVDAPDGLGVVWEFSTELFSVRTIRGWLDQYLALLGQAADSPDTLPRMRGPVTEPAGAVRPDLATSAWTPDGLAGLVTARAAATPHAPALYDDGQALSYRELEDAASRLAGVLATRGVRPGDRVGVLAGPALTGPVALLAVLKCGAAYVPLDPQLPPRRAAGMLAAAGCRLLVCVPETRPLADRLGLPLVDASDPGAGDAAVGFDPPPVYPDTLAYVMFTSGSTGAPKPVMVPHRAALCLAVAAAEVYQLRPTDVVAQLASLAVDVSVEELFASWYAGAAVAIAPDALVDLTWFARRYRLTVLNMVAARWHEWVRELLDAELADPSGTTRPDHLLPEQVRLVVTGSDRLDPDRVRAWQDGPGRRVRLLNAYGTTETAVSSAWYDTADYPVDAEQARGVPIGGPLPHAVLHVVDEDLAPVPDGVPGELYIGGPGVALGYLDQPATTAHRFVPDPFAGESGARMYRTGDRVRRLPSGALDFLGRLDEQVKVHGHRIELGEVEAAAAGVPGVAEFVADTRAGTDGAPRLIGYVRPAPEPAAHTADAADRVEQWGALHDAELFNEVPPGADPALNSSGWLSSYSREPIPLDQMREWRDATLDRLRGYRLGRVLEIGCGTGMILLPLAPDAEQYTGVDVSPRALEYVERHLTPGLDGKVRLERAAAHELPDTPPVDLVILNSVVQYFPDLGYLEQVLEQAWGRLRPGGRLFVGDVRDLTTLRTFHLSVLLARGGYPDDPTALAHAVAERADSDSELCLDPRYFAALGELLPDLAAVDVQVKCGRADTEMNRYRYDVTLWRGPVPGRVADAAEPEPRDARTGAELAELINRHGADGLRVTGLPDRRIAADVAVAELLGGGARRVSDAVRAAAEQARDRPGPHPDEIRHLAARAGCAVAVRPAGHGLLAVEVADARQRPDLAPPARPGTLPDRTNLASQPLRAVRTARLAEAIRTRLRILLPEPMVPSRLVFVAELPRTSSGKVDRSRLPDPPRALDHTGQVPPRTELESTLCAVWEQVLGLDTVGVRDNFFDIGGDSIRWLQVVSRLARAGVRCTARDVFDHQTVEELARMLPDRAP